MVTRSAVSEERAHVADRAPRAIAGRRAEREPTVAMRVGRPRGSGRRIAPAPAGAGPRGSRWIWMKSRVSAVAVLAHRLDERAQPGNEAIVADAQERSARRRRGCRSPRRRARRAGRRRSARTSRALRASRSRRRSRATAPSPAPTCAPRRSALRPIRIGENQRERGGLLARRPAGRRQRVADARPREAHVTSPRAATRRGRRIRRSQSGSPPTRRRGPARRRASSPGSACRSTRGRSRRSAARAA